MNYFLIKLTFNTAVHFGSSNSALSLSSSEQTFCADTLFSALCHTALAVCGPEGAEQLCEAVRQDRLRLSDAMPWRGDTLYLPKPLLPMPFDERMNTADRKAVKKAAWLPVKSFDEYLACLRKGYFAQEQSPEQISFGVNCELTKAAVTDGSDAVPYQVGLFRFAPGCGLYFLCACASPEGMERLFPLLRALGQSGIGGKVTSGYGRFEIEDEIYILLDEPFDEQTGWLHRALTAEKGPWLLLTSSLPADDELDTALEGASFQLMRRGGFVAGQGASAKKKTQHFLRAGSVLNTRFEGALYDVAAEPAHPALRYAKPLFLGVTS